MPGEVVAPSATQPALPNAGFLDIAGTPNTVGNPNPNDRKMSVWVEGGVGVFLSTGQNAAINDNRVLQTGLSTGDSDREFAFKFTLSGCPQTGCDVMLGWTGHIASAVDWGDGKGARSISGAPFHMRILGVDNSQGTTGSGNQDRSVQLSAIVQQTLTVNKVLVPSSDGGRFNLQIDGATAGTGASVGDGGTTGLISVNSGSHTVSETAAAGTNLSNYTTTIDCGSGPVSGTSTTVNVPSGGAAVCAITNTLKRGSVTIVKKVLGASVGTFPYAVTGLGASPNINITTAAGTGSVTFSNLAAGTKTVAEGTLPAGWSFVSLSCSDPDNGTIVTGQSASIDLDPGEDITCTYTNRFTPPKLIVIKHVINDNGGTATAANFTMSVTATNPTPSSFPGAELPGTDVTLSAGAYSVGESGPSGYAASYSADCSGSIADGETKTCTVTNDDISPTLKLVKTVVNDNGGTKVANDFARFIDGGAVSWNVAVNVNAGSHTASETTLPGYTASSWGGDCAANGSVTLALAENKVCTITNDDISPTLTLVKTVINDNGGTKVANDFARFIDGNAVSWSVAVNVNAGSHTASETTLPGYAASAWGGDCAANGSVTLGLAENKTCTITNDDISPTLKLVKTVVNDNGGTLTANDFPRFIDGNAVSWNVAVNVNAGSHTASETTQTGYAASVWGTDCAANGTVTLALAENKVCTITNDDISPTLKLVKTVVNDNGGTKVANDFARFIDGNAVSWSVFVNVNAGSHTASETTLAGYAASAWGGDCAANGTVTLGLGDSKTCTITNNDISPTLTLVKTVINDNGGTKVANDFPRFIDGNSVAWSVAIPVNAGSHTASETSLYGYTASSWGGDCAANGGVTLALAENKTCTITNDDQPGTIIVKKIIKPTGATTSFNFDATGNGYVDFALQGGQMNTQNLNAGNYSVMEMVPLGWALTGIGGSTDPAHPTDCTITGSGGSTGTGNLLTATASITLKNGDTVTCVFENTGQGATRTQGFWATHPQLAQIAWFGGSAFGHTFPGVASVSGIGDASLCGRQITTLEQLMGGFWSGVSKTSTGAKRSSIDQARMQLLQQLLAAELNASAFGSVPGSGSFAAWESAYCGTNQGAINTAQSQAASFNSQGDTTGFTPGTSADSQLAKRNANYAFWDVLP